jgi:hypothetical protein
MTSGYDVSQDSILNRYSWLRLLFSLLVCVAVCSLYYRLVLVNGFVELDIEVTGKSDFRIFWPADDGSYSERRMARVEVYPGKTHYSFYLTDLRKIEKLRIDPFAYRGKATLRELRLSQQGLKSVVLSSERNFEGLRPLNQVEECRPLDAGMEIRSSGADPYLEMALVHEAEAMDVIGSAIALCFIFIAVFLVIYSCAGLLRQFRFVPLLLFGAWILVIVMAGISKRNVHPDEYVHMYAVSYYQDNWLPPLVEDPDIRNSYSVYGVSRLNSHEIFYFLAGKYEKLVSSFRLSQLFSKRLFNISLFGLIFFYTVRRRRARLVAVPLLLSPQLWYVFSYCNSDALAVTVAFFAACQLVDSESVLQRYLQWSGWGAGVAGFFGAVVLLGLMFLLKKNYYPFIVFFYFCFGLKIFFTEEYFWERKRAFLRLFLVSLLGLAVLGGRLGMDYYVNGPDRQEKIASLQEELARHNYKPSTPLDQKNQSIQRKNRGVSFKEMFYAYQWGEKTFQSSFGVFGYFTIAASTLYYNLVRYGSLFLLVFVFGSILLRGGWQGAILVSVATALSVALIGASAYQSWTVDFQAQGRYLFPIAGLVGIVYGQYYKRVNAELVACGVVAMYLLSCYNFIFNGLVMIPKVPL